MIRRWVSVSLVLVAAGCGDDLREVELAIDLQTDLVPGDEFVVVTVEVDDVRRQSGAFAGDDYAAPRRVTELTTPPGSKTIELELQNEEGGTVAERTVHTDARRDTIVRVIVTRSCRDVTCPSDADPPNRTSCLGGRCVDPSCQQLSGPECPGPACESRADCPELSECAAPHCSAGVCLYVADVSLCDEGQMRSPTAAEAAARGAS